MPIAGKMRMYTSGWPNNQNKCCQRIVSPAATVLKKLVPKLRSKVISMRATVMIGKAKIIRNDVTKVIQVNTGMRMSDMPGARRLMNLNTKLKAPAIDAVPSTSRASDQKSVFGPGPYARDVRLA